MLFARHANGYSLLDDRRIVRLKAVPALCNLSFRAFIVVFLSLVVLLAASFVTGRWSATNPSLLTIPLATESRVFRYNPRFGSFPSNISDAAWKDSFPAQGGFFKHPSLAPKRSAFSVFHQLHCLDGIRHGYWEVYKAAIDGRKMEEDDFSFMASPPHIRHCIDLLRQSLMCQPDTTIEVKDDELGGVTGFGTRHECRDWKQLMDWTSKWQWYDYGPKPDKVQASSHQQHDHRFEE